MSEYVAFLRGINVGGRIIRMADLRACFEKAGFKNVSTLLQSGNVLFESDSKDKPGLKRKIETVLTETFGYPAIVFIYSVDEVRKVVEAYPFDYGRKDLQHYVVFLEEGIAKDLDKEDTDSAIEEVKAAGSVIYWSVQKGMTLKSRWGKTLAKAKYKNLNTVRNLNTLKKVAH